MGISDSVVSLIITEWLPYMYWYVYECMYPLTVQLYSPVAAAREGIGRRTVEGFGLDGPLPD